MALTFPLHLFPPGAFHLWPAATLITGGSALAGPGQTVDWSAGGWWMGEDLEKHYPEDGAPTVRGEAINTGWTYGYDAVTMMQETKVSMCRVVRA